MIFEKIDDLCKSLAFRFLPYTIAYPRACKKGSAEAAKSQLHSRKKCGQLTSLSETLKRCLKKDNMHVSKNRGTPKSSILMGFSVINHPFWGTSIFGNIHMLNMW